MKRLTLEQLQRLHARLLRRFGSAPGVRDPAALDAEQRYQLTMRVADGSPGMTALTNLLREAIG